MRRIFFLVFISLTVAVFANASSTAKHKDDFAATLEYDSTFESVLITDWSRALSEANSVSGQFLVLPTFATMAISFRLFHKWNNFRIGAGLGASFGRGSFGIQPAVFPERFKFFLGRDVIPYLSLRYADSLLYLSASSSFWIPTQESHDTALWVWYITVWPAVKWNGWKIGPMFEPYFVKEGRGSLEASELRIGGAIEKAFDKVSFSLFLGYDPYKRDLYLGAPKDAGFIGRGAFDWEI